MVWVFIYIVVGLAAAVFLFSFLTRIRTHISTERLSLVDYVSVASTLLNVVLLLLAVVSLHVAYDAYSDAKDSGAKQEESLSEQQKSLEGTRGALESVTQALKRQGDTLEKSRESLNSSVKTAVAQQELLARSLANSKRQLDILEAEWKRELEQPDIHAAVLYPQEPAIFLYNTSKIKLAREGSYQLIMVNLDRRRGARFQVVQTVATPIGVLGPGGSHLPSQLALQLDPNEPLVKGNRLFGYLIVDCAECKVNRFYWVFLRYGEEGVFREANGERHPLQKMQAAWVETSVSDLLQQKDLIRMPKNWAEFDKELRGTRLIVSSIISMAVCSKGSRVSRVPQVRARSLGANRG
jgi:hypothetical protein